MLPKEEWVLAISRQQFNPNWRGFNTDTYKTRELLRSIKDDPLFVPRFEIAEKTTDFLQIIPWYMYRDRKSGQYFAGLRSTSGQETELHNQYVLGFGGHIWPSDLLLQQYVEWGSRELREELIINGKTSRKLMGMVYQQEKPVEKRHLGIVYLIQGDGSIALNSHNQERPEYASGQLMLPEQINQLSIDSWSRPIFNYVNSGSVAVIKKAC